MFDVEYKERFRIASDSYQKKKSSQIYAFIIIFLYLESQVPRVVVPDSDVPASKSPGLLDTRLAIVDLPTPAFPKNMFAVIFPSQEFSTIFLFSSIISENKSKSPLDTV